MSAPRNEDTPAPGYDTFSADDLAPSDYDKAQLRNRRLDQLATTVAVIALGMWAGGMLSLGACAAPMVFKLAPYPFSGKAMGAAFARFDNIAIGCGLTVLACEFLRTWLARRRQTWLLRVRRYAAILLAAGAVISATMFTPEIMRLHNEGVRRRVGPEGEQLERVHKNAELIGKVTVFGAMLLVGLHVFTVRGNEDDETLAVAPLPPG